MSKPEQPNTPPHGGGDPEQPAPEQGTWIIRPLRRKDRRPSQADLPLDDAGSCRPPADPGDKDDDLADLNDLGNLDDVVDAPPDAECETTFDEIIKALEQAIARVFPPTDQPDH